MRFILNRLVVSMLKRVYYIEPKGVLRAARRPSCLWSQRASELSVNAQDEANGF